MRVMEFLTKKLSSQYPDISMISDMYNELVEKHNKSGDDDLAGDSKYRPLPLLIAVLYKMQARNDSFFKTGGHVMSDHRDLQELVGYYWHVQHQAGKLLREGINGVTGKEQMEELINRNRDKICEALDLTKTDVPHVSVSELCQEEADGDADMRLEDHCPDFVISVHHCHKAVVFTILGTRIFPRPHPHDIIMDLAGKTEPFHHGLAHSGMVAGHRNLLKQALPKLSSELSQYPGYSLLIVGYSLGAGLAHLFTMELELGDAKHALPENTKIRAITYGCPPVFTVPGGEVSTLNNILMVSNHNDGITGASLKCINDIFLKTKAIHKLNLQRRTLLKMAFNKHSDASDDADLVAEAFQELEMPEEKEKSVVSSGLFSKTKARVSNKVSGLVKGVTVDVWDQVEEAIENIPKTEHAELTQVGRNLIVMRKSKDEMSLTKFSGREIRKFSCQIRFKYGMFDDHMPWGYSSLFSKVGSLDAAKDIGLEVLDLNPEENVDPSSKIEEEEFPSKPPQPGGLYPDLSSLMN